MFKQISGLVTRMKKIFPLKRPVEIDENLEKLRSELEKANEITRRTKATLDGEEDWFINRKRGDNKDV